jgi:hypothetical protein
MAATQNEQGIFNAKAINHLIYEEPTSPGNILGHIKTTRAVYST